MKKLHEFVLLGKACLKLGMSLKKECCGELEMAHRFGCSMINGFLDVSQLELYHAHQALRMIPPFPHSLIRPQWNGMGS